MKTLTKLLIAFFLFSCSSEISNQNSKTKKVTERKYSTKSIGSEIVKDTLSVENVIGYDTLGNQTYFLGLTGYPGNDTTWVKSKNNSKMDGNKTFFYDDNNKLRSVAIESNDTLYSYSSGDLIEPSRYQVKDEKGLKVIVSLVFGKREEYTNRIYNEKGDLTFCIIEVTYVPTWFDLNYKTAQERLEKEAEVRNTIIKEIKIEYY